MNKLMPLEYKSQRIMTTKVLAEEYGTEETNIQTNFTRNQSRFVEGKHYYKLEGQALKEFKKSLPTESMEPLKYAPQLILWTDRGAARHAKILDTDEAWEVYESLEENYFNPKSQKQLGPMDQLKLQYQVLEQHEQKLDSVIEKVEMIEDRMTIETGKQKTLCDLVNRKVMAILGGKNTPAYKELNKKAFSQCWRDFKEVLGVASYKDTPIKDFDLAKKTIIDWQPNRELELMIRGCNIIR